MDTINTNEKPRHSAGSTLLKIICSVAAMALTVLLLWYISFTLGSTAEPQQAEIAEETEPVALQLMDSYDAYISEIMSDAYDAVKSVKKVFWISEDAETAPVANAANYGETTDPTSLQWLLDEAAEILDGQELLFSTDVDIYPGSTITYYLDETIFAITWKEIRHSFIYTMCEVKVAHPSQFRRFIADGTYGSQTLLEPTTMAANVNAVAAISGDYYRGRNYGIVVYDGVVYQASRCENVDTCYVDVNGDLHFTYRGEIADMDAAQKFVDENNISFSLAFGPILIDNGVRCEPEHYPLGEVKDEYPRAAICQKDKLHYILVAANYEGAYYHCPDIHAFAEVIETFDVQKAYTLDGGKTGAIAMDGKLVNPTHLGRQRRISDIIYFGTALPDGSE